MVAKRMANIPESGTVRIANIVSNLKAEGVNDHLLLGRRARLQHS